MDPLQALTFTVGAGAGVLGFAIVWMIGTSRKFRRRRPRRHRPAPQATSQMMVSQL